MSDTPQPKKSYTEAMKERLAQSKKATAAEAQARAQGENLRRDLGGKPAKPPHGKPPQKDGTGKPKQGWITFERLPDGSRFDVVYDSKTQTWSGTLTVPGHNPFSSSKSAVHKLITHLDQKYRRSIQPPKPGAKPDETPTVPSS